MAEVRSAEGVRFETHVPVLIVGAGACGLVAALKATDGGAEVLVLERDAALGGSTAMSSGFVPAGGTRFQREQGIEDDPDRFAEDIQRKAKGRALPALVEAATRAIGPALEWLDERHGIGWRVLDDFLYPGHSRARMHAVEERSGAGLMTRLQNAAEAAGIPVATEAAAQVLYREGDRIVGVGVTRRGAGEERIGCDALILASSGFAGNPALVAAHVAEMADAPVYAHPGNRGEALIWGQTLGAGTDCLGACQGHGSLAHPHGILVTWALMMEGGIQVNAAGERFANEHDGYSEQSVRVLGQEGGIAWCVFGDGLLDLARRFPDFRALEAAGAMKSGKDAAALAEATGLPAGALAETLVEVASIRAGEEADPFERDFTGGQALEAPLHAVKVTGALFHTQGGLLIDGSARVLRGGGAPFPNLLAGGGAACGVSGPDLDGYLSGNGLLTAIAYGALAGESAASQTT